MAPRTKQTGFTLIELMIVVAILAVLAAVAIVSYIEYQKRARNSEATSTLSDIRLKQENYRSTFHQYACTSASPCPLNPARSSSADYRVIDIGDHKYWKNDDPNWRQLGVAPEGSLYFSYATQGGSPGGAPTGKLNQFGTATGADFWYVAMARQDMDGDGQYGCFAVHTGTQMIKKFDEGDAVCAP